MCGEAEWEILAPMTRIFAILTGVWTVFATAAAGEPVKIFAAASLGRALDEVAAAWPGEAVISYGGSGGIARQVAAGAPADIVILANTAWIAWLEDRGALQRGSARDILGNRLVLVAPEGAADLTGVTPRAILERLDGGRLAVGQVLSVPAGIYAKEWMQTAGLWDALSPYLAETVDVRAALALVARGEAPLGIVYATDVRDAEVRVLHEVDPSLHAPIRYGAAIVHSSTNAKAADFMKFLAGEAQDIFISYGFRRAVPE